jgi:hypothetical protein
MRPLLFLVGILLLIVPEILRVYYIMPFPGSQEDVATDLRQVNIAYWLHLNIWWVRLIGVALVAWPTALVLMSGKRWARITVLVSLVLAAGVIYLFNFKFMADKMFLPVEHKSMAPVMVNAANANDLVVTVERNGDARAYPIELVGYHHQVLDTIGGEAVMITYCTVCRTGRAFSPVVNGEPDAFRLVGMDHYNAMFEDSRTKSWWRQATGECIAGPLKGQVLTEVPSQQMTLAEWTSAHPNTLVLQPDPSFLEQYTGLKDYDEGTIKSSLEYRDTASWQPKSWVVGVVHNGVARAYDWNELQRARSIKDLFGTDSVTVALKKDQRSFTAVVMRRDTVATSQYEADGVIRARFVVHVVTDTIPAYQEFWHSWRTFHPNTTRYEKKP